MKSKDAASKTAKKNPARWQDIQPFRPTSVMGLSWVSALEGTTHKNLQAICKKHDVEPSRILRTLKRGFSKARGFTWKIQEEGKGQIRIYSVARMDSKAKNATPKKAAKKVSSKKKK